MTLPFKSENRIEIHLVGIGKKGQCLLLFNVRFSQFFIFAQKKTCNVIVINVNNNFKPSHTLIPVSFKNL